MSQLVEVAVVVEGTGVGCRTDVEHQDQGYGNVKGEGGEGRAADCYLVFFPHSSMSSGESLSFADLPEEIVAQVFACLADPRDVFCAGRTCRSWRRVAHSPDAWRKVEIGCKLGIKAFYGKKVGGVYGNVRATIAGRYDSSASASASAAPAVANAAAPASPSPASGGAGAGASCLYRSSSQTGVCGAARAEEEERGGGEENRSSSSTSCEEKQSKGRRQQGVGGSNSQETAEAYRRSSVCLREPEENSARRVGVELPPSRGFLCSFCSPFARFLSSRGRAIQEIAVTEASAGHADPISSREICALLEGCPNLRNVLLYHVPSWTVADYQACLRTLAANCRQVELLLIDSESMDSSLLLKIPSLRGLMLSNWCRTPKNDQPMCDELSRFLLYHHGLKHLVLRVESVRECHLDLRSQSLVSLNMSKSRNIIVRSATCPYLKEFGARGFQSEGGSRALKEMESVVKKGCPNLKLFVH
ncbi:hypothetical protein CBR_g4320 [Chara braunii]|uniref:F-box domain-containing protein n=1 Tax=Chara braunii TaxID=69332 RepID=A0A388JRN0_CHABU|nr:hypothetical protein CBR_g4320 [Chara braunii]|eukprot:GBG60362.1 hypothetical protein CBR_g4320 [Chara braunii]